MKYSVIILCAGSGRRSGLNYNKMLYVYDDKTVFEHTVNVFINDDNCDEIIITCKDNEMNSFKSLINDKRVKFVLGGNERQDSVYNGLQVVTKDYVLIHDGARPFIRQESINDILSCLEDNDACLLMVPCKDTIKRVVDGKVVETLNRNELMQAQTPQAFKTEIIKKAYQQGIDENYQATDDAQMIEKYTNINVKVVVGDYNNIKITTKDDLR